MSDYTPQTWHDAPATDTPIDAERLGYIEAGIAEHEHPITARNLSLTCPTEVDVDLEIGVELNMPLEVITGQTDPALLSVATNLGGPNFQLAVNGAMVTCNPLLAFAPQLAGVYVFKWYDPFAGESNIPLHCVNVGEGTMTWVSGFLPVNNADDLALPRITLLDGPGPLRVAAHGFYVFLSVA